MRRRSSGWIGLGCSRSDVLAFHLIDKIEFRESEADWKIGEFTSDKKSDNKINLPEMEAQIANRTFENTHAVLINQRGEMVYENYFDGYHEDLPHDTRSASKSVGSAVVGIAKDRGLFQRVDQSIFDFIPADYQSYKSDQKAKIDIKSLLTMSSGLDADDSRENSAASEDAYQSSADWLKTVLSATMMNKPNTHANYSSANPYLLGLAVGNMLDEPLAVFMDRELFKPLGITNYVIQNDDKGNPYFGGGLYFTPRDLMKFGQLYLNKGNWKGNQLLSEEWVNDSFKNYLNLENTKGKNGYGYLWWHHDYTHNGRAVHSVEARGSGGQYIFVLPELEAAAVITSGNYRNGKTQQPEAIFEKYVLPALLK